MFAVHSIDLIITNFITHQEQERERERERTQHPAPSTQLNTQSTPPHTPSSTFEYPVYPFSLTPPSFY